MEEDEIDELMAEVDEEMDEEKQIEEPVLPATNSKINLRIRDIRLVDLKIIDENKNVVYEGSSEEVPEEFKDLYYKKIYQIRPVMIVEI